MAKKMSISFKETTKDMELFMYLNSLEDKSNEIKNLIRLGIKALEEEESKK